MKKIVLPFLASILLAGIGAPSAPPGGAIVVPLHADVGKDGEPRLGIDVTIGSSTQRVLFDTGSTGLRVLAKALPADAFHRTGRSVKADFGFGVEVRGEEASAPVGIGAARASALPFQVIDEFGCAPQIRDCPQNAAEPSLLSGIYTGIFGAYFKDVGKDCCVAPFGALDGGIGRRYIVHARFDAPTVTLNPDPVTLASFSVVDYEAFGAPRGCLRIYASGTETCGPVIFDTGTPQLLVTTMGIVPPAPWTHATLRIGAWTHDFQIGSPMSGGVPLSVHRDEYLRIVVGLMALQDFDVYYDVDHHRVGIVNRK